MEELYLIGKVILQGIGLICLVYSVTYAWAKARQDAFRS